MLSNGTPVTWREDGVTRFARRQLGTVVGFDRGLRQYLVRRRGGRTFLIDPKYLTVEVS